jgi:hypothetical protein
MQPRILPKVFIDTIGGVNDPLGYHFSVGFWCVIHPVNHLFVDDPIFPFSPHTLIKRLVDTNIQRLCQ